MSPVSPPIPTPQTVQYLIASGWKPALVLPAMYTPASEKLFTDRWDQRQALYLRVLILAPFIFKKPGNLEKISHVASHAYYKYLVMADDLSNVAALTDIEVCTLTDKQFKEKVNMPKADDDHLVELDDAVDDVDGDGMDVGVDLEGDPGMAKPMPAVAALPKVAIAPLAVAVPAAEKTRKRPMHNRRIPKHAGEFRLLQSRIWEPAMLY